MLCAENLEAHSGMMRMRATRNIGPKSTNRIPLIKKKANIQH
jgi:hypothetical protein